MLALEAWLRSDVAVVRFRCGKGYPKVRCFFAGQSDDGKKIKVSLDGHRRDFNEEPVMAGISARVLRIAAAAFDAPWFYMDLYAAENCLIVDQEEKDFHARMIIGLEKPNRARSPPPA
jgi:hypothetical protein